MKPLRILIADDHPLFRKGIRALIETMPDVALIGEAQSGQEAVDLALAHQPDIVLMDLHMPGGSGLSATRELNKRSPNIRILVVTLYEDNDSIFTALRAGAHGYILKYANEEEMMRAIRAVANNEAIFSASAAERMLSHFAAEPETTKAEYPFPDLTPREREVLGLVAQGYTNQAIADKLVLSPKTVRNQVSIVFSKLQVGSRTEAIIKARDAGLGDQKAPS
jgi:DNA-binding NarL/FixJ family response regulator